MQKPANTVRGIVIRAMKGYTTIITKMARNVIEILARRKGMLAISRNHQRRGISSYRRIITVSTSS